MIKLASEAEATLSSFYEEMRDKGGRVYARPAGRRSRSLACRTGAWSRGTTRT